MLRAPRQLRASTGILTASTVFDFFRSVPATPPTLKTLALSEAKKMAYEGKKFCPPVLESLKAELPECLHAPLSLAGTHWRETRTKMEVVERMGRLMKAWRVKEALDILPVIVESSTSNEEEADLDLLDSALLTGSWWYDHGSLLQKLTGDKCGFVRISKFDAESSTITCVFTSLESYIMREVTNNVTVFVTGRKPAASSFVVSDLAPTVLDDLDLRVLGDISCLDEAYPDMLALLQNRGPCTEEAPDGLFQEVSKSVCGEVNVLQSHLPLSLSTHATAALTFNDEYLVSSGNIVLDCEGGPAALPPGCGTLKAGRAQVLERCFVDGVPWALDS